MLEAIISLIVLLALGVPGLIAVLLTPRCSEKTENSAATAPIISRAL